MNTDNKSNYKSILKSLSLLGGSSLITMFVGMVKTKFVAVLLGPSGVGIMSVLIGLKDIVVTIIGMGLNSSGIRQIAACKGVSDERGELQTISTLRILVWVGGLVGILTMVVGSVLFSRLTFKSDDYSFSIAWLGLAVLATSVSAGQSCVLQGLRQIKNVAKANILGAIIGAILCIGCFLLLGNRGIVASLILTSFGTLFSTWWYARKINLPKIDLPRDAFIKNAKSLYLVGLPIAATGLLTAVTSYLIRLFLTRAAGLEALGIYQAAFTLSGVLVSFVLTAMGTDYYPRLSAISSDNKKINEEVNAQTEIALLLAIPVLVATVSFLPFIVKLLYSSRFDGSTSILRWSVFGVLAQVISWPMGFILLAKAKSALYMLSEITTCAINVVLVVICYHLFGLEGCGIAFALLYLWYFILMQFLSKKIACLTWTRTSWILTGIGFILLTGLVTLQSISISPFLILIISFIVTFVVIYLSLKRISVITGITLRSITVGLKKKD